MKEKTGKLNQKLFKKTKKKSHILNEIEEKNLRPSKKICREQK